MSTTALHRLLHSDCGDETDAFKFLFLYVAVMSKPAQFFNTYYLAISVRFC